MVLWLLQPGLYALSVLGSDRVHHFSINMTADNVCCISQYQFTSLEHVIHHYSNYPICRTGDGKAVLLGSRFIHDDAAT